MIPAISPMERFEVEVEVEVEVEIVLLRRNSIYRNYSDRYRVTTNESTRIKNDT